MKKFFAQFFIALSISVFAFGAVTYFSPAVVHAQTDPTQPGVQTAAAMADEGDNGCGITNIPRCISDMVLWVPGFLMSYLILPLMSLLVYLSGMILNWSVHFSVVDMAERVKEVRVEETWRVIRDLANMGFIFVLIYTALRTMFDANSGYQKVIRNIVIAALLINFSMFLTMAIIDASNVLAMLFYKAIAPGATDPTTGIASAFMDVLGVQGLFNVSVGLNGTKMAIIGTASTVIMLIASFTFIAVALMFLIRFVVLILVIVLSPIMVVGSIFPESKKYRDQWVNALIGQAFFAPAYFMLTWITLKMAQGLLGTGTGSMAGAILGKPGPSGSFQADPSATSTLVNFLIIIALMIASILIAKSVSEKSGGAINNITKRALGLAGASTMGVAGRMGRGTIGRAGSAMASSQLTKDLVERGGASGRMGRLMQLSGEKAAKSSFDIRATGIAKNLDAGKVKKNTSFEQDVKDRTKAATERVKFVGLHERARAAEKEEKEARERLKSVADRAAQAHPDATPELDAAEKAERDAAAELSKHAAGSPEHAAAFQVHEDARTKAEELRKKQSAERDRIRNERAEFIRRETEAENKKIAEASAKKADLTARSERFINKQGEPAIGSRGIGAHLATEQRNANAAGRNKFMRPLAWLGGKIAPVLELRQKEGDKRVEAIRKEINKSDEERKKEKEREELVKAAKEGAKEGAKKDDE